MKKIVYIIISILIITIGVYVILNMKCNNYIIYHPEQGNIKEYYSYLSKKDLSESYNLWSKIDSKNPTTIEGFKSIYDNYKNEPILSYIFFEDIKFKDKKEAAHFCIQKKIGF